jgi:hypothetical protein
VTAESWCGRAAGIDGPTWVMATYKIADCTRYIPYPIWVYFFSAEILVQLRAADRRLGWLVAWVVAWGWGC